ncbi:Gfo/Idh/MocA family oxidoreductase [Phaeobacter sp. J2-8]|uniref:Gfo/Idh/MocA family protein n=1 Tax=Phaeobacter sp. J2-8 TaxID=2931394 RepID=UPI001FD29129|nr:Gfo/Idh/MocA family oxidoreductase [Phaeobacter sp. J2-8]MCJ7873829.1 Gfo/Idh/MocA family oxidoreductase [Phaeobacter sp. J2-8]
MADHVRWGVLGAANFARRHMAPAIHLAGRGTLAALATSSADKAAGFQRLNPDLHLFDDYDALLASDTIDAVYVPLPNHLHVEWAEKALRAGKHVLVEKPLAMKAEEFDSVIALRDKTGLVAAEAYMVVHHPRWQKVRELVQGGEIGEIMLWDTVFSYDNRADTGNIRNRADTGGGAIPDIGVYTYGTARFVTGEEPQEILSTAITWENGVDVWSHITAQFPSFHFSGVNSMRMVPRQNVTIQGDKGMISVQAPFNAGVFDQAEVTLDRPGMERVTWRWPGVNHYVHQVENFNASVLDGADYPCPLEFSRGTQAMIDMVFAKAGPAT